jgi:hypothetical protein
LKKEKKEQNKKKSMIFTLSFMLIVLISLSFIEFRVPHEVKSLVTVAPPLPQEIKNFVAESHKAQSKKHSRTKKPSQSKNPTNNSSEALTDNKPDEAVSNPFGGSGGGQEFGGGSNGDGGGGGDNGGSGGGGYGELVRLNAPVPNQPNTDYSGQVAVLLTVNDKGVVISAKSTNGTTHPDQNVIKLVVDHVKKNVKFKAQLGAPIRTAYYTVQIDAG